MPDCKRFPAIFFFFCLWSRVSKISYCRPICHVAESKSWKVCWASLQPPEARSGQPLLADSHLDEGPLARGPTGPSADRERATAFHLVHISPSPKTHFTQAHMHQKNLQKTKIQSDIYCYCRPECAASPQFRRHFIFLSDVANFPQQIGAPRWNQIARAAFESGSVNAVQEPQRCIPHLGFCTPHSSAQ